MPRVLILAVLLSVPIAAGAVARAEEPMLMASAPSLSPDGETVVFTWRGDIWSAPIAGGGARRLTMHPGRDSSPRFSPDGREIAFVSDRGAGAQVYVMTAGGGLPVQLTFDTNGYTLLGWYPGGKAVLVQGNTDRYWRRSNRFFRVPKVGRTAPKMLFDAYGNDGSVSPDGTRLLFTREGTQWWRKGYRGSQAAQIWIYDLVEKTFKKLLHEETGSRWPVWMPDGKSFLYVGAETGNLNLMEYDLESGERKPHTRFPDDTVVTPTVSGDGSVVVFRHLFDLYRYRPGGGSGPELIPLMNRSDTVTSPELRRKLERADAVAFSRDGLEVAFTAGGDLFVMDTVLREPVQVTNTTEEEREPVFAADGNALFFTSDQGGQGDLWRAERANSDEYWWRNKEFTLSRITDDPQTEGRIRLSPDGERLALVKGQGELVTMALDGSDPRVLLRAFSAPSYAWSPDGKWIAYAVNDDEFNMDVWIVPADGSTQAVNVSRHPDNEGNPTWSPNGKILAFTGRRWESESDIHYVWLAKEDDDATKRDRTLEEALEKMKKGREKKKKKPMEEEEQKRPAGEAEETPEADEKDAAQEDEEKKEKETLPEVVIDFEGIHDRVKRISIPKVVETGLFWSPDGTKLAFSATIDGKAGTYQVEIPKELKPKLLVASTGSQARWIKEGNKILWLVGGLPAVTVGTKTESLKFRVRQVVDRRGRQRAAFDLAWRTMRDSFYDGRMNNRDWDAIREKYRAVAAEAPDTKTFAGVVNLMLGELNASHTGFRAASEPPAGTRDQWTVMTGHLGLRFELSHPGPGLKVLDVIKKGPTDKVASRVLVGETVLAIDGTSVDSAMDLTQVLNVPPDRALILTVRGEGGEERTLAVRPVTQSAVRRLLYGEWLDRNRKTVKDLSNGALGYLHIRGMSWSSFFEFERMLYSEGYGKDGLVIDVRNNGGGFTTDHLLTALTQPVHAITKQRGGGPGYPQDRKVYATWSKPIVVLCNQNSFSNAEIFSHAVKTLGRGQLVGVPTAGGVISTGHRRIMDLGTLRTPGRGWFILGTGEDMERNGAVPHHVIWPEPGDMPAGKDAQLEKAVEVLQKDVAEYKARPRPKLRKASER